MRLIKLSACFLISILCLIYVFKRVNLSEIFHLLIQTNLFWVFIATLICISKEWITGLRFRFLSSYGFKLSTKKSFYFYAIGTMTNMILPLRAGDFLRARITSQVMQISNTTVLGIIVSEHVLDIFMLIFLLAYCYLFYSYSWENRIQSTLFIFSIIILLIFFGLYVINKYSQKIKQFSLLKKIIMHFYSGFFQFGNCSNFLRALFLTVSIWILQGCWIFALLYALKINTELQSILILIVVMGVSIMVPASPGYIGTFHLLVMLALMQMDVTKNLSLSFAILAHAHGVSMAILIGLYCSFKGNLIETLKSKGSYDNHKFYRDLL